MLVRPAIDKDMNHIYSMGFEAWAEGASNNEYLKGGNNSSKYRMGQWHCLEKQGHKLPSVLTMQDIDDAE